MKYCDKCGKELEDDVRYCPNCGNDTQQKVAIQQTIVQSQPKSNGMAVAGFVCAFLFPVLGLIFGVVGIVKAKKAESGLGLSIAAIVISIIEIIIIFVCLKFVSDYVLWILSLIGLG